MINTSQLKKIAAADDCSPDCQLTVVYLISRLAGQHVENLLGLPKKLASLQKSLKSGAETERLKNLVDYQADCYAGLFFKSQANRRVTFDMSMFVPMLARLNTSSEPGLVQARETLPGAMSEVRRQWFLAGYESASNISTCEGAIR